MYAYGWSVKREREKERGDMDNTMKMIIYVSSYRRLRCVAIYILCQWFLVSAVNLKLNANVIAENFI